MVMNMIRNDDPHGSGTAELSVGTMVQWMPLFFVRPRESLSLAARTGSWRWSTMLRFRCLNILNFTFEGVEDWELGGGCEKHRGDRVGHVEGAHRVHQRRCHQGQHCLLEQRGCEHPCPRVSQWESWEGPRGVEGGWQISSKETSHASKRGWLRMGMKKKMELLTISIMTQLYFTLKGNTTPPPVWDPNPSWERGWGRSWWWGGDPRRRSVVGGRENPKVSNAPNLLFLVSLRDEHARGSGWRLCLRGFSILLLFFSFSSTSAMGDSQRRGSASGGDWARQIWSCFPRTLQGTSRGGQGITILIHMIMILIFKVSNPLRNRADYDAAQEGIIREVGTFCRCKHPSLVRYPRCSFSPCFCDHIFTWQVLWGGHPSARLELLVGHGVCDWPLPGQTVATARPQVAL